ncbi:hypothetical protein SISNIDRAFT_409344 [Sistotremastrum niveocremeum HHB9708]|uniref:MYND-type domain-containing protein n=1 Tax=Sistotremastrum niveocremeum HHB9708 TaxID=1314777 RepID=A0A164W8Y0_9AGAM|nr:hypothetical protein SISNIDRAFT_409344 [Sistotremastrum niveocremeum HHB9708]
MATRHEMISNLRALGIELHPDTKMSEERLKKKLHRALDCAQLLSKRLPSSTLDPANLKSWKGPSQKAFVAGNAIEGHPEMNAMHSASQLSPDEDDHFSEMRQALYSLAQQKDQGLKATLIQDEDEISGMCIKFVDVLHLDDKTPVMILLYDHTVPGVLPPMEQLQFCARELCTPHIHVVASQGSQKLLQRLLLLNSRRLPASYQPPRQPYERNFKLSFVLPAGPLSMVDLGTLNEEKGCDVCGEKATQRCSACESVMYCGKACQTHGWRSHKTQCKALSLGSWSTIKFQSLADTLPMFNGIPVEIFNMNRYTRSDEMHGDEGWASTTRDVGPNIHGTNPFVIKIQTNGDTIRVYDRRRSLDVYLMKSWNLENFLILHTAAGTGFKGLKCYRWAKRVSDWELSICLDRKLPEDPRW